ncbi:MAG TPA: indolepyruvate ferredoxin oxidoreductase subunit beta [Dehalococcoidales bacterium]|nr:indolepyruvate ferredoxin oxidoreductase subunit beta [Dehalococcoidales bacterium]
MVTDLKELNIIIAGTGGQGVVVLSELLGNAAVTAGFKVRGSEVLGMAQRGGSVFSNIRLGTDIESPMTAEGKCDILIAVEPSEALRNIQFLSKNTTVVLNIRKVIPYTVSLGQSTYPEIDQIVAKLKSVANKVIALDAVEYAEKAGNRQSTNVVMIGALFGSGKIPISPETMKEHIATKFAGKGADVNIKAFDLGYDIIKKQM